MNFEDIEYIEEKIEEYCFPGEIRYNYIVKSTPITERAKEKKIRISNIMKKKDITKLIKDNLSEDYKDLNISFNSSNKFIVSKNFIDCEYTMDNLEFFNNMGHEVVTIFGTLSKRCLLKKRQEISSNLE